MIVPKKFEESERNLSSSKERRNRKDRSSGSNNSKEADN